VDTRDDPRRQRLELTDEFHVDPVLTADDASNVGHMQLWRVTASH